MQITIVNPQKARLETIDIEFTLWLHKKCNILKEKTCGAP